MPSFEINKRYFGPDNSVLAIIAIDGNNVTVEKPISGIRDVVTVADVEAWKDKSDRRIYYPPDPEDRRIKIATFTDTEDESKIFVDYLDIQGNKQRVTFEEWQEWRNALPD